RAAGRADPEGAEEPDRVRRRPARPRGRGREIHRQAGRRAGRPGSDPGRGDRRPGDAGGETARNRTAGRLGMRAAVTIALATAALLCPAQLAAAQAPAAAPPWEAADAIRADLFEAQTQLLFGERAGNAVGRAERRLGGPLRAGLAAHAPAELREVEASLAT